jgi:archaellum component FlaC
MNMGEKEYIIYELYNDISNLENQLRHNREKIARLKKAESGISNELNELVDHKPLVFDPELTPDTWQGKYADMFLDIRNGTNYAYTGIVQQTESLLNDISKKISELEAMNTSISNSISSKRSQLAHLKTLHLKTL